MNRSGILSIASHLLGVQRIKALDIDEMAVNVAKENFKKNHCDDAIEAVPGNLLKMKMRNLISLLQIFLLILLKK